MKKYLVSLKKNKGLKLLDLFLAQAAWYAVGSVNEIPSYLEIRVQGPRSVIRDLASDRLQKQIDLANAKPGNRTELLTPGTLNFPRGVVVTRIRPSALSIELDQAQVQRLEVQPVIKGSPAPGFEIGEVVISPKEALVRGPKNDVSRMKYINTIPIDISKLSSSISREVELDFQNLPLT